jgi:hypothetical protein
MEPVAVSIATAFEWGFNLFAQTFPLWGVLGGVVIGAAVLIWASDYV